MGAPRINVTDRVAEMLPEADRKAMGIKTRGEIDQSLEQKGEAEIQSTVENWLRLNGFWPRSPAYVTGEVPPCGWYIHLHKAKRNPYLLDLLILSPSDGRYLELELKTEKGKLKDHQKSICETDCAPVARSAKESIDIIKKWHFRGME